MRKRVIWVVLAALWVGLAAGFGQEAEPGSVNLSDGRGLGVGMQLDYPFGGLLSGRFWFSPAFAGEAIFFVWSDAGDLEGTVTVRTLYRIADAPVVDFYGAAGATIPISTYGYGTSAIILSAAGGIEFGFRSAPSFAWNIEFGLSASMDGDLAMLFGTGIHFYFLP
jgi:hypothetical protein